MTDLPLVSVITPTWQRHEFLLGRSIPSVARQTYPNIEHIVVSDGPDEDLFERLCLIAGERSNYIRFAEVPQHDPAARWGHHARLAGIELARGDLIAYLDDDNSWRPDHLDTAVRALAENPWAHFWYPQVQMHVNGMEYVVGTDPPVYGGVDTSGIVHRAELLELATWQASLPSIDWDLVHRWMLADAKWVHTPQITVDYYK